MKWTQIFIPLLLYYYEVNLEYVEPGPKYTCPKSKTVLYPCLCIGESDAGISVYCENSNLASLSIGISNTASLHTVVSNLHISSCNISKIYGDIFYTLNAKKIVLSDVPLLRIDDDIFLGVGKWLKELQLLSTNIIEFPTDSMKHLGSLIILIIDKNRIISLPSNSFSSVGFSSIIERLSISNGNISILESNTFEPLKKLKYLNLRGNQISELKRNQFKGLSDLEVLDLSFNKLQKLDASYFIDLPKLTHCNISHNSITALPRGTFARNSLLRVLNLSHNQLKKLDANMFRGMRLLNRVFLNDNQITNIDRGTFLTISRIGTINLARNQLSKIDYQMFHELQLIENIDLSENVVTVIEKLAFKGLYLVNINLSHNKISKIERGAFEMCINVTKLDLSYNRIQQFETNAFDELSYATEFQLSYNDLTDLSQVPLTNMTGLKVLNVTFNKITTIPKNTFPKLYELHTIDLSHNHINKIAGEVLQSIMGLRSLNLSYNSLNELNSRTFGKITTLLELDLKYNNIKTIKRDAFTFLISLQTLDLSHNMIEDLFQIPVSLLHLLISDNYINYIPPGKIWPQMNTLLTLDLSSNLIGDSLEKGAFKNLLVLQNLMLSHNNVSIPPIDSLQDFTSLRYLNMRGNKLEKLSRSAFGSLPVLFELDLSNNRIKELEVGAFSNLLQLRTLILSDNSITLVPNGAFKDLLALNELDISKNFIENIDNRTHNIFEECLSLKLLNISNNQISSLKKVSFPILTPLQTLDLSYNKIPVLTLDMVYSIWKLKCLNISHNIIEEIREGVIGNLSSIELLDISSNLLSSFSPKDSFSFPKNLSALYMGHNYFSKLPVQQLINLKSKLKILDVRYNLLSAFYNDLLVLLENGTHIMYGGNPILCNCNLRPLRFWLVSQPNMTKEWSEFSCFDYEEQSNNTLVSIAEESLWCDDVSIDNNREYDITPDVKFREIRKVNGANYFVSWYVLKNKDDIAGFMLEIQNSSFPHNVLYSKELPYHVRTENISGRKFVTYNADVCIIAKTSNGDLRTRNKNQCHRIPDSNTNSSNNSHNCPPYISFIIITAILYYPSLPYL